ncbi:MAG: hypothetical protein AAGK78_15500, partial [Planctomycetota bacterium]
MPLTESTTKVPLAAAQGEMSTEPRRPDQIVGVDRGIQRLQRHAPPEQRLPRRRKAGRQAVEGGSAQR